MRIDGFTLAAQLFNFVLLLVVLRLVLYRPILELIHQRSEALRQEHEDARVARETALAEEERFRAESARLERERADVLAAAEREAEATRTRLKREAREEVEHVRAEWTASLEREADSFLQSLRTMVARQVFDVAREVLHELAEEEVQTRAIEVFLRSLDSVDETERRSFEHLAVAHGRLRVRTAQPLSDEQRAQTGAALRRWLGPELDVSFETDPSIGLGVELLAEDRKLGWSVKTRLDGLEKASRGLLDKISRTR